MDRLEPDGIVVKLTYRNPHRSWDKKSKRSVHTTISLLNSLLQLQDDVYNVNKCGPYTYNIVGNNDDVPRQQQSMSCGIHCCAHIVLAGRGQIFENHHTFGNTFINNLRSYALLVIHNRRVQRSQQVVSLIHDEEYFFSQKSQSSTITT